MCRDIDESLTDERFNHQCEVVSGVLEEECGALLTNFLESFVKRKAIKIREEYWELTYFAFSKETSYTDNAFNEGNRILVLTLPC